MVADACSLVKADLEAGSFTNYTEGDIVVYIENKDKLEGGNVYILLEKTSIREPIQSFTGSIIYTKGGCSIIIRTASETDRDNIYNDIIDILNATNRGYTFDFGTDQRDNENLTDLILEVSLFL